MSPESKISVPEQVSKKTLTLYSRDRLDWWHGRGPPFPDPVKVLVMHVTPGR